MIKELLYKWFNLEPIPCETCEVYRVQLESSERERRELLKTLIERNTPPAETPFTEEELKPIGPKHIPWRVRQQLLEAEDREKARIMRSKQDEISKLEKEVLKGA